MEVENKPIDAAGAKTTPAAIIGATHLKPVVKKPTDHTVFAGVAGSTVARKPVAKATTDLTVMVDTANIRP